MNNFTLKFLNVFVASIKLRFHFLINISIFFKLFFNAYKDYSRKKFNQLKKKYTEFKEPESKKSVLKNIKAIWRLTVYLITTKHNTIIKYIIIAFLWFLYFNINSWETILVKSLKIDFLPFSEFLQGNKKIDLMFCIFILTFFIVYMLFRINDHRYKTKYKHFILALSLYPLISDTWIYSNSINFPFFYFIYSLCFLGTFELFHSIHRFYYQQLKKSNLNNSNSGFIIDEPLEDNDAKISTNRNEYATQLVARLQKTDTKEHAFAVGVVGTWGHGKSSFLNMIKKELQNESIIINFNPWYSNSKDQIIADFFDTLKGGLSKYNPALSKSFSEYANALSDAIDSKPIAKFTKIIQFWNKNSDLKDLYDKVSNEICKIDKRIYIFIDDLDRLEKSEIMEVLRLIRNTASFKNTIFIVGYDREYIIDSIISHGLTSANQYLEKIFSVEVTLPVYEKNIIVSELLLLINVGEKNPHLHYINKFINKIDIYSNEPIITKFLYNLRDVKRFVNIFTLNFNSFYPNLISDINPLYLFQVELIKYRFFPLYKLLRDKPNLLLKLDDNSERYLFEINKDDFSLLIKNESILNIDENEINMLFDILKILFSDSLYNRSSSMCFLHNYSKYFAYRLMNFNISRSDFLKSLTSVDLFKQNIDSWIANNKTSSILSMIYTINLYSSSISIDRFKILFEGLIHLGLKNVNVASCVRVSEMFFIIETESTIERKEYIDQFISSEYDNDRLLVFSKIFNNLYHDYYYEEEVDVPYEQPFIYNNSEIEKILKEIFVKIISSKPSVDKLFDNKSIYSMVLDNCIIEYAKWNGPDNRSFFNSANDMLMDYIDVQIDGAQFLINKFNPKFCNDEYENEIILRKVHREITKYFNTMQAYKKLISNHTGLDLNTKNEYFTKLKIESIEIE